ncbi:hypothetical protein CfE428DRAFT_4605 [Chthoniobacter flavus Ellin428]|uniref:Uncharacterized protein n=1 Tax=Chthoniobacter flavus Ellin428 TaxID=497964 RepID=B4D6R5_9BACT|nr:hypothetical protein [Chthoniobacter flavus]EDY17866.1 hypothetical protein CfE428DRAFT_4605 [Chthoniobacter flavus Ellin428]
MLVGEEFGTALGVGAEEIENDVVPGLVGIDAETQRGGAFEQLVDASRDAVRRSRVGREPEWAVRLAPRAWQRER